MTDGGLFDGGKKKRKKVKESWTRWWRNKTGIEVGTQKRSQKKEGRRRWKNWEKKKSNYGRTQH